MKNKLKSEDKFLWICGMVFLCIFLISGFFLLNYWLETRKQEKMNEELAKLKHGYDLEYFTIVEGSPIQPVQGVGESDSGNQRVENSGVISQKEQAQKIPSLSEINSDYVFWLEIADSSIDYPVVYRDNDYYLRRDFYGEKSKHGTIFLDANCEPDGPFLLLHGHNMKDGTMFGGLREFKKKEYRAEHKELRIGWEQKEVKYRIVAGVLVDLYDSDRFVFEKLPGTDAEAATYFDNLKKYAFWCEPFEWESGKSVVLLSTCDYETEEQRLVIFAIEE